MHSAAKDHFLPDCFARIDPKRKTPDNAMFLYSGLVLAYLLVVGDFRRELTPHCPRAVLTSQGC